MPATAPATEDDRVVPFRGSSPDTNRGAPDGPLDVKPDQIRLLNQHPSLILVNLINGLLVVLVRWHSFPRYLLLGWYALLLIAVPIRLILARASKRHQWPTAAATRLAVIGSAATGAIWGLLAWPITVIPDLSYSVFIVFALGGMTAGAVLLDAAYLPAFSAFVLPIVVPTTLAFVLRGDPISLAMSAMLAVFAMVQAVTGFKTNHWIVDTLRLQVQRESLTADLRIMANHDQLTGLFNRYYLLETLASELSRARRMHTPITVAILDIDHFKSYNDTFGHEAGDEVLRATGAMLKDAVRASDFVCRYGGEEFLIVFLDSAAAASLPRLKSICDAIKQHPCRFDGRTLPSVSISVGVAEYPRHTRSVNGLIRAADRALYAAKKAGRGCIEILP